EPRTAATRGCRAQLDPTRQLSPLPAHASGVALGWSPITSPASSTQHQRLPGRSQHAESYHGTPEASSAPVRTTGRLPPPPPRADWWGLNIRGVPPLGGRAADHRRAGRTFVFLTGAALTAPAHQWLVHDPGPLVAALKGGRVPPWLADRLPPMISETT